MDKIRCCKVWTVYDRFVRQDGQVLDSGWNLLSFSNESCNNPCNIDPGHHTLLHSLPGTCRLSSQETSVCWSMQQQSLLQHLLHQSVSCKVLWNISCSNFLKSGINDNKWPLHYQVLNSSAFTVWNFSKHFSCSYKCSDVTSKCRQPPSPTPPSPSPPAPPAPPAPSPATAPLNTVQVTRALDQVISIIEAVVNPQQGRALSTCTSFILKIRRFLFAVETSSGNWLRLAGDVIFTDPPSSCSDQEKIDLRQLQDEAETVKTSFATTRGETSTTSTATSSTSTTTTTTTTTT